jgi:hypothetical protein
MSPVWAQRHEELLRDCIVSPDVFNSSVAHDRQPESAVSHVLDFLVPDVRSWPQKGHVATAPERTLVAVACRPWLGSRLWLSCP